MKQINIPFICFAWILILNVSITAHANVLSLNDQKTGYEKIDASEDPKESTMVLGF